MGDFCSENTDIININNYSEPFDSSKTCLPNGGAGFAAGSMSQDGIVNASELSTYTASLIARMDAAAPFSIKANDLNPGQHYTKQAALLRANIKKEYCFYYKRYMYALEHVLFLAATKKADGKYNTMKANTEALNSKLNQILQILQGLINSRTESLKSYYGTDTGVNKLNVELDSNRAQLVKHSKLIRDINMERAAKVAMVNYTVEKNNSSRNLLAIYGFMNIVAVGLLYYLYRNTKHE
jgi:hypothetical protein